MEEGGGFAGVEDVAGEGSDAGGETNEHGRKDGDMGELVVAGCCGWLEGVGMVQRADVGETFQG